ncbi:MAG TPA: Dps family protein [Gammaproteobacteria bacterium]|nr:Dps family protein [Gammaproteobacteria bacterium]
MEINIGMKTNERKAVADKLARLLADSYTLYLKTHNYHWNVTGPMFQTLHTLFENQYNELATAVDTIAERIRALGEKAPGSYRQFAELATVKDAEGVPSAEEMIRELAADHETVSASLMNVFEEATKHGDEATISLVTARLEVHQKAAWMLRAHLE